MTAELLYKDGAIVFRQEARRADLPFLLHPVIPQEALLHLLELRAVLALVVAGFEKETGPGLVVEVLLPVELVVEAEIEVLSAPVVAEPEGLGPDLVVAVMGKWLRPEWFGEQAVQVELVAEAAEMIESQLLFVEHYLVFQLMGACPSLPAIHHLPDQQQDSVVLVVALLLEVRP